VTTRADNLATLVNGVPPRLDQADTLVRGTPPGPTPLGNPYATWTTLELVDYLVSNGGMPVTAYVEYGQRVARGDITGDGRVQATEAVSDVRTAA
jgi:hypothetical protein